jgi:pyruvate kinase
MAIIAQETEKFYPYERFLEVKEKDWSATESVAHAACTLARHLDVKAIVAFTQSGTTARQISRFRPSQPIIVLSPNEKTLYSLALQWNVIPYPIHPLMDTDSMFEKAAEAARHTKIVTRGDTNIITADLPVNKAGITNMILVREIGE